MDEVLTAIDRGNVVGQQTITNVIVAGGPEALEEIVQALAGARGVDRRAVQQPVRAAPPASADPQFTAVTAAQQAASERGVPLTPPAAYQMGLLAAYRRDYEVALDYFRQAGQQDPTYSDAFEAIAWLQQSRAGEDILSQDYDAAAAKLAAAQQAADRTDPLDPRALVLRGYIYKSLAQVAEATGDAGARQKHYQEAARYFRHVVQLVPDDAGAHNGLGNIEHALGNLDAAITAYRRAVALQGNYTAAYHDLALACEAKMQSDPERAGDWCREAIQAWEKAYRFAPDDPGFSAADVLRIGQSLSRLRQQCGGTRR
jgi:tetratricopeptide (TPR) repeat protein